MENKNENKEGNIIMQIQEFNQSLKKMDDIYHQLARNSGLSDTAFWIIYAIETENKKYKQKDLCDMWSYSKQTINSALKKMEEQNVLKLVSIPDNKKDKKIVLTEYGEQIAKQYVQPVTEIEKTALSKIRQEKRNELINLFKEYIEEMNKEAEKFMNKEDI